MATESAVQAGGAPGALGQAADDLPGAVEGCPDAFVVHQDGAIAYANPAAAGLLGAAAPGELLGRRLLDFVRLDGPEGPEGPEGHEGASHPVGRARLSEHAVGLFEERLVRADGTAVDVELASAPTTRRGRPAIQVVMREITARRRAEQQLALYREIVRASTDAIAVVDLQGQYLEQNDAHRALTGYADEELRGRTPAIHLGEPAFAAIVAELARTGRFRGELRSRAKDGAVREIELSAFVVRDAAGAPVCYVGIKRDIAARKDVEARIEQGMARQQALYQLTDAVHRAERLDAIYELALAGLVETVGADRAAVLLFDEQGVMRFVAWRGLSAAYRAAVEGHSPWSRDERAPAPVLVPDIEQEPSLAAYAETFRREGIGALGFIPLTVQGRLLGKFMLYYRRPHAFVQEELQLTEAIARHIAFAIERRQSEQRLRAGEETQRLLASASKILGGSLDYDQTVASLARLAVPSLADWCIVDVAEAGVVGEVGEGGQRAQRLAVAADAHNQSLLEELCRRYPVAWDSRQPAAQAVRAGRALLFETMSETDIDAMARDASHSALVRQLGPRSVIAVPLVAGGRTLGAITFAAAESGRRYGPADLALAEDLAHRCALAVYNASLYRDARSAVRAREEFFSIASHELKTPITTLLGFAQLERRRFRRAGAFEPGNVDEALGRIEAQASRLSRLVAELLDVSRLLNGQLGLTPEETDLTELAAQVVGEYQRALAAGAGARPAPPVRLALRSAGPVAAAVDRLRIEQVLRNLLDNAVKFSPQGGEVVVEVAAAAEEVRLAVRDHGAGIAPEDQGRVFERFYRGRLPDRPPNTSSRHAGHPVAGMGLGLYISRQIVEQHGGTIALECPAEGGARFVVVLPAAGTPAAGGRVRPVPAAG